MKTAKPYLIRAYFDWLLANKCTPLIIIDTQIDGVLVPENFVGGDIVLNISPEASPDLKISNTHIKFTTSFDGVEHHIEAPINAIQAIYAYETTAGLLNDLNDYYDQWEIESITKPTRPKIF